MLFFRMPTKVCPKCLKEKEHSEYHRCAASKDGYYFSCKECSLKRNKEYYARLDREFEEGKGRERAIGDHYVSFPPVKNKSDVLGIGQLLFRERCR